MPAAVAERRRPIARELRTAVERKVEGPGHDDASPPERTGRMRYKDTGSPNNLALLGRLRTR